mmetsp:Transcript_76825/g.89259  ORF Transcript_76825/g.89259 Transcript_76825/m.89259 type:complete len:131 (-) Transcript_76825:68-460(-)
MTDVGNSAAVAAYDGDVEPKPQLPRGDKNYIACKGCHTILTEIQYMEEGCQKCGERAETREGLVEHTTNRFFHAVGLVAPQHSWIARVIGCSHMPTSVYAAALEEEEAQDDQDEEEDGYDNEDDVDEEEA